MWGQIRFLGSEGWSDLSSQFLIFVILELGALQGNVSATLTDRKEHGVRAVIAKGGSRADKRSESWLHKILS